MIDHDHLLRFLTDRHEDPTVLGSLMAEVESRQLQMA